MSKGFIQVLSLILSVIIISIVLLLRNDMHINDINVDIIATSNIASISLTSIFISRLIVFLIILWSCITIYVDKKGLDIKLPTRGIIHDVNLKHEGRFTAFTVWCWTLQGIYFFLSIISSINKILVAYNHHPIPIFDNQLLLFITWVIFEISFSMSFLVTIVVTFVLIPGGIKRGINNDGMFKFFPLLFHNANVFFMVTEILTNNMKFSINHFPFVLLYGCAYSMFSWWFFHSRKCFLYFFLDYDGNSYFLILLLPTLLSLLSN